MNINDVKLEDVLKLYDGANQGCRCGCNGEYYYPKAVQAEAGIDRGYAVDDDEIAHDSEFEDALQEMRRDVDLIESDLSTYGKTISPCTEASNGGFFNLPRTDGSCITIYLRRTE